MSDQNSLPHKATGGGWLVHVRKPDTSKNDEVSVEEYQVGIADRQSAEDAVFKTLGLSDRTQVKAVQRLGAAVLTGHSVAEGQIAQWQK